MALRSMPVVFPFFFFGLAAGVSAAEVPATVLAGGLNQPESIAVADDGRVFVSCPGEKGQPRKGAIFVLEQGQARPFCTGLDQPMGLAAFQRWLFVADRHRIRKIDSTGKAETLASSETFPTPFHTLEGLAVDIEKGTLYTADPGNGNGRSAIIFRVGTGGAVDSIAEAQTVATLGTPAGLLLDGASFLLTADPADGKLRRVRLIDGMVETVAEGLGGIGAMCWDHNGRLFLADRQNGRILVIPRPGEKPVVMAQGFQSPSGMCLDRSGRSLLVVDSRAGTVSRVNITVPGAEIKEAPLAIEDAAAFPSLKWTGWTSETAEGKVSPLRPIVLTHAGDGTNRVFVATQQGVIHVFANDQRASQTQILLDISDRVRYQDKEDEEGLLGLAFHPRFKQTGEFFLFYTPRKGRRAHTNLLSRFRVRKDDPNRADRESEEVLLTVEHPFYNHDGGTVCFGPDGYLYLALGDGGAANDPFGNGQNLKTLLGKVLRLDVDKKEGNKPYAIPKDNPFAGRPNARPEIWTYGLRNVWRFSFDRRTGACWAADVGQNLWEEIDLLVPGGNYGWNVREGMHPFGAHGSGPRADLIDPIWEYHHLVGKSITGGGVYRGKRLPELDGAYLFADYVSGAVFALRYDPAQKRVTAVQPVRTRNLPVISFGEDEEGEMYFLRIAPDGRGISRFERAKTSAAK